MRDCEDTKQPSVHVVISPPLIKACERLAVRAGELVFYETCDGFKVTVSPESSNKFFKNRSNKEFPRGAAVKPSLSLRDHQFESR